MKFEAFLAIEEKVNIHIIFLQLQRNQNQLHRKQNHQQKCTTEWCLKDSLVFDKQTVFLQYVTNDNH